MVFAFFPSFARASRGIALLYGQVLLALAVIAYLTSGSHDGSRLAWGFIALFGGYILVFVYQLAAGVQTFAQVGPPQVISVIFTVLLLVFRGSETSGRAPSAQL